MTGEPDPEYLKVINDAINNTELTWIDRMQVLLDFKRVNRGLKGINLTLDPSKDVTRESVAKGFCMMEKACAEGNYEDVTEKVLKGELF